MSILNETVVDLKAKHKTGGVKIRRLEEGTRSGTKQYKAGLRASAEAILAEAEKALNDDWKDEPGAKEDYKTRKQFIENDLREYADSVFEDFIEQLEDEVDVVLTHKHGI